MTYFETHRPDSIVVFRALQLGDLLCTMPTFRALRAAAPEAHIALVGLPGMAAFAARYPAWIDEFIPCPGVPGFPEQPPDPAGTERFRDTMRRRGFALALQMQGNGHIANALVGGFGAATTAGFCRAERAPDEPPARFIVWDDHRPEVLRGLDLLRHLGAAESVVADTAIDLPVRDAERAAWQALRRAHGFERAPFVCVHAGARWPSRRWPLDRFAAVALELARRDLRIVLTGSDDERPMVAALASLLRSRDVPVVDVAGKTSLGVLAALLQDARLLVCNDTGISHVAAATRTPSVVVASGSDVARWAPLDRRLHRVLAWQVPCRPCSYWTCPIDHPCATGTSVEAVVDAIDGHAAGRHVMRHLVHVA